MKADLHKTNCYKIFSSHFRGRVRGNYGVFKTFILYVLLFAVSFFSITLTHFPITYATTPTVAQVSTNPQILIQQGKALYEAGQYAEAIIILQQAAEAFKNQGDGLKQAMSLSNLSLAYQQLGQWKEAQDAITSSLQLLVNSTNNESLKLQGAAFDIQGQLYLAQGQTDAAVESFSSATAAYTKAGDEPGNFHSQINQAQALQASGMYRRALNILQPLNLTLQTQPDSQIKAIALRSLGNTLRMIGNLDESQHNLEQSLAIAQRLPSPQDIGAAFLGLGNTARAKGEIQSALNYYQQASEVDNILLTTKIKAQLNELSLFVDSPQLSIDSVFLQDIQAEIAQLPPSQNAINARINLARSLMKLGNPENSYSQIIADQLKVALQQAQDIQDSRSQSYALGQLGELYEQTGQYDDAQKLTEQALILSQSIDASDIAYSLQWQLGRLLKIQGNRDGAIAAYTSAVNTLQSLRRDLVSINPDVQFSFRESVEPVYRELVSLLLQSQGSEPTQQNLTQARDAIESLQQAELVNFFREDCLNAVPILIDQVDQKAAVIYPIVLNDRLEVVLSLPGEPLRHYATFLPRAELERVFSQLRTAIAPFATNPNREISLPNPLQTVLAPFTGSNRGTIVLRRNQPTQREYLPLAQKVYDWLIRPIEPAIAASGTKTLVFVLDGPMLNLPMAVLHDGQQFLVENYAIALTPGLQLLNPQPLVRGELSALKAGISEGREQFAPLPFVKQELNQIGTEVPGKLLLNQEFTNAAIQTAIDSIPFPVVHLATHGQFSSNAEDTFILTWDGRLNVNQLNNLLQTREGTGRRPIELLVLSACQTAAGDIRAALGLAGVAVRAGARSTLATLWLVDDRATAELMIQFYRELNDSSITKVEALRRAQVALLHKYQQPRLWAPFVLVGNWL